MPAAWRTWIETGKVMPFGSSVGSYKELPKWRRRADGTERLSELRMAILCHPSFLLHFLPVFPLTGFTDPRIHTVGRIVLAIKLLQMSPVLYTNDRRYVRQDIARHAVAAVEIVFSKRMHIHAFFNDVILMEDIAHKMAVIELVHQLAVDLRR